MATLNKEVVAALHERFKRTMNEIESENDGLDYTELKRIVNEKVFEINDKRRKADGKEALIEMCDISNLEDEIDKE